VDVERQRRRATHPRSDKPDMNDVKLTIAVLETEVHIVDFSPDIRW
jgi:hypothetical protein